MSKQLTTESDSCYDHLEKMSTHEILSHINEEDSGISEAVKKAIPEIQRLVEAAIPRMLNGGRLFYVGAGTSGRLGIVDASECPPTFGVSENLVIGLIAGGNRAMYKAVEFAEDDKEQGWKEICNYSPSENDTVIGIAASGKTPYVIGAVEMARKNKLLTGCITCNLNSELASAVEFPIEIQTGPEFISGSTRMKAGTAQKLTLNMVSTSLMIRMGRVKGNKMVDMHLSNQKLLERGVNMLIEELGLSVNTAKEDLNTLGSVRNVLEHYKKRDK